MTIQIVKCEVLNIADQFKDELFEIEVLVHESHVQTVIAFLISVFIHFQHYYHVL